MPNIAYMPLLDRNINSIDGFIWNTNGLANVAGITNQITDYNFSEEGNVLRFEPESIAFVDGKISEYVSIDLDTGSEKKYEIQYDYDRISTYSYNGKRIAYEYRNGKIFATLIKGKDYTVYSKTTSRNIVRIVEIEYRNSKRYRHNEYFNIFDSYKRLIKQYVITRFDDSSMEDVCFITELTRGSDGNIILLKEYRTHQNTQHKNTVDEFEVIQGDYTQVKYFTYHGNRLVGVKEYYDGLDMPCHTIEFVEYDEKGNWIRANDTYNKKLDRIIERKIIYK